MGAPKRIQLSRKRGWRLPANAVRVGRPTLWGNPFTVIEAGDAATAVAWYREWLDGAPGGPPSHPSRTLIREQLRGKDLACWCRLDQPCHADVLLEIANAQGAA